MAEKSGAFQCQYYALVCVPGTIPRKTHSIAKRLAQLCRKRCRKSKGKNAAKKTCLASLEFSECQVSLGYTPIVILSEKYCHAKWMRSWWGFSQLQFKNCIKLQISAKNTDDREAYGWFRPMMMSPMWLVSYKWHCFSLHKVTCFVSGGVGCDAWGKVVFGWLQCQMGNWHISLHPLTGWGKACATAWKIRTRNICIYLQTIIYQFVL